MPTEEDKTITNQIWGGGGDETQPNEMQMELNQIPQIQTIGVVPFMENKIQTNVMQMKLNQIPQLLRYCLNIGS